MSFHESRAARAAERRENHEERANETSTVFEWPARQKTAPDPGADLKKTSSIFEWPTKQQAAQNHGENLKKTSMIFERPTRQKAAEIPLPPRPKTTEIPVPAQRSAVRQVEPEREKQHLPSTPEPQLIGRTLANKYTIESVIGTGSMGTIYRARQIALDKPVSIKILHQELAEQRTFVERFKLEAFSASSFEHPNSLRVLDFGADGDLLYLVMEYVEADDLLNIMRREWPFEDARIAEIMCQALAALAKAHEVGIVHRDIKPENILMLRGIDDEGNTTDIVKVCDFGIAKVAGASAPQSRPFAPHLTTEGLVVGTPDYMSPEQARGDGVDGRSDLYSMGVVLYHLLAGRPPFVADTPFGIAIQHVSEIPAPPSRHRAVNPALESICLRAMNKRPADRFQTAREMRRALLDAMASEAARAMAFEPPMASEHAVAPGIPASPAASGEGPSTALQVETEARGHHHATAPSTLSWPDWARHVPEWTRDLPEWARRPNAIAVAALAIVVTVVTLALAALVSRFSGQDSSWGNENVVRSTTIALTPGPPANTADDTQPAAGASAVRARPAAAPAPVLQR